MHLFEIINAEGLILSVFAETFEDAATLFCGWFVANHGNVIPDFEIRQRNPNWPGINTRHLLVALAQDEEGIGRYDRERGWTIHSPLERGEH